MFHLLPPNLLILHSQHPDEHLIWCVITLIQISRKIAQSQESAETIAARYYSCTTWSIQHDSLTLRQWEEGEGIYLHLADSAQKMKVKSGDNWSEDVVTACSISAS